MRGDDNRLFSGALGFYNGVYVYTFNSVKMKGFLGSYLRPEGVLSVAIAAGDVSLTLGPASPATNVKYGKYFPATGTLLIDNEQITYTARTTAGVFTGLTRGANGSTAASHTATTLVTLNNVSKALGFGAEIAARIWGKYPARITQEYDYGMENGVGIEAYYGQKTVVNNNGDVPNCLIMENYAANPNTTI